MMKFSIWHGGVKLYDCADEHDVCACMILLLKGGFHNVVVTRVTTVVKQTEPSDREINLALSGWDA